MCVGYFAELDDQISGCYLFIISNSGQF